MGNHIRTAHELTLSVSGRGCCPGRQPETAQIAQEMLFGALNGKVAFRDAR
jgi:hypothetical protein